MSSLPRYSYWIYTTDEPVDNHSDIWSQPLPLNRDRLWSGNNFSTDRPVRHKDYFRSARRFLEKDGSIHLLQAVSAVLGRQVTLEDIIELRICLVKHGAFYHPSRVETIVGRHHLPFALNVAVTSQGRACMNTEYRALKRLNHEYTPKDIPAIYGFETITDDTGRSDISMFLAEWFDGFCEFHLSSDSAGGKSKIKVWDSENGDFYLKGDQVVQLYQQAARIMTRYYHVTTFEHIFSWHHAAGDFVVRQNNGKLDIKLITVRHYIPLLEVGMEPDASRILHALLLFFLNLSIRMRLDRMDGTGPIVWADDAAVEGTVAGFFKGLEVNRSLLELSDSFLEIFRNCLADLSIDDITDLLSHLVDSYEPHSPDIPVICKHLQSHAVTLAGCLKQI